VPQGSLKDTRGGIKGGGHVPKRGFQRAIITVRFSQWEAKNLFGVSCWDNIYIYIFPKQALTVGVLAE
jgi:hypothetical protein